MSVAEDLKAYLIAQGVATAEKISISRSPAANLSNDDEWVIVAANPAIPVGGNLAKWRLNHTFNLLYRTADGNALYAKDDVLRPHFNPNGCVGLVHYKVLEAIISSMDELAMSTDEVHVANWQVQITTINQAGA